MNERTAKQGARDFLTHVEQVAHASLEHGARYLKDPLSDDYDTLQHGLDTLRPAFGALEQLIAEHGSAHHDHALWTLLSSAFIIGSRGTISHSGRKFALAQKASSDAKRGARTRRKDAEAWHSALLPFCRNLALADPALSSPKIADAVERERARFACAIPARDTVLKAIIAWRKAGWQAASSIKPA